MTSPAKLAPPAKLRPPAREPLWRHIVGDVLRRERLAQERTLKEVSDEARISMPYLSEVERGRKEASSEVLAAAARALGLGLADLLTLAQDELARMTPSRPAETAVPASQPGLLGGERTATGDNHGSTAPTCRLGIGPAAPQMVSRQLEMSLAA
ncbi:MAG TPA: helix-turn-helix transcriptional regulator [Streptosporangiaceae bacterium]